MKESTLVKLLSRVARQILGQHDTQGAVENPDECAERLAEATWDGLIVLLRQSLARGETVVIDGLGSFVKEGQHWVFLPSSTLARADALSVGAEAGRAQLANLGLFYLDQASGLLDRVPEDAEVRTERQQPPMLRELAGAEAGPTSKLSDSIRLAARYLLGIAERLSPTQARLPTGYAVVGQMKERVAVPPPTDVEFYDPFRTSLGGPNIADLIREAAGGIHHRIDISDLIRKQRRPDEPEEPTLTKS